MSGLTGEQLYDLYKHKNAEQGCTIDDWEDLEERDHTVWRMLAIELLAEDN